MIYFNIFLNAKYLSIKISFYLLCEVVASDFEFHNLSEMDILRASTLGARQGRTFAIVVRSFGGKV